MPPTTASTTPIPLPSRQRAWHSLPSGSRVRVLEGSARLHLHHCLGSSWVAPPVLLRAGDSHVLQRGGWIEIEAVDGAARLQLDAPVPWFKLASLWPLVVPLRAWLRSAGRRSALRGGD